MSDSGADGPVLGIAGIEGAVEIGRAASHTTYRVRDTATGRTVVIKLLNAARDWPGARHSRHRCRTARGEKRSRARS